MKIRNKILLYFSTTIIALSGISLSLIYILFLAYREEEFQQRQNRKIKYTVELITEFKKMSEELSLLMDKQNIHAFYDEKLLIFDSKKELIFSSIDDLPIKSAHEILNKLSPANQWIETKDGAYDLIGSYIETNGKSFYAVSKAYDEYGYTKLNFLRNVLITLFFVIVIIVILMSLYLSNKISKPITLLAENLNKYDLNDKKLVELEAETSSYELSHLTQRFNELLKRTHEAFAFQKHAIHHISHELKTPISILVSELEKTKNKIDDLELKTNLEDQVNKAKSLGEIINALLEISKIESGQELQKEPIRTDEIIFDVIEDLNRIYPNFYFELQYFPNEFNEKKLIINADKRLIKQVFQNLMTNCITYSDNAKAEIKIDCSSNKPLTISIINSGKTISKEEEKYLFNHFFRGENSRGKIGFGLGLVLTKKIISFHSGTINYHVTKDNKNTFKLIFD
jgi:signal transduction histidine kinase